MDGLIVKSSLHFNNIDILPIGSIVLWDKEIIPDGWALCDGENETPNFKGYYIKGSNVTNYKPNGKEKFNLTSDDIKDNHKHTSWTTNVTGGSHNHTTTENGFHNHSLRSRTKFNGDTVNVLNRGHSFGVSTFPASMSSWGKFTSDNLTVSTDTHDHDMVTTDTNTDMTDMGYHGHDVIKDNESQENTNTNTDEIPLNPSYYKLYYIRKVKNSLADYPYSYGIYSERFITKNHIKPVLPRNIIMIWDGEKIPDGWALCDGNNGTPNLINKYVMATKNLERVKDVSGSNTFSVESKHYCHNHPEKEIGFTGGSHKHKLATRTKHSHYTNQVMTTIVGDKNNLGQLNDKFSKYPTSCLVGAGSRGEYSHYFYNDNDTSKSSDASNHRHTVNTSSHSHNAIITNFNGTEKAVEKSIEPIYIECIYIMKL